MVIRSSRHTWSWVCVCMVVCALHIDALAQEITVSRIWVDFYGAVSWADGGPVESGTLIQVYDPEGTLNGEFTVTKEGMYGFMAVFGDDPLTADIDEGAEEGETLSFHVNGLPAQILYGGNPTWTQQQLKILVNLRSSETAIENRNRIPRTFELSQNYPNPFNPSTRINLSVPRKSHIRLVIYNMLGQEIELLIDEIRNPGRYVVEWNAEALPSGVYLVSLIAGDYVRTKKLVLQK